MQITPNRHNWVEVIPVASHLRDTDQSHVCLTAGGEVAELSWPKSASTDVEKYNVYGNAGSGNVDYTTLYATVWAKPGGEYPTGNYTYTTRRLASGTWNFGVRAVDEAGNVQTTPVREDSCTITRVPEPPGAMSYSYEAASKKITLTWTAPTNWT